MPFIEIKEVVKQYDGHLALDRVSMDVPQGRIYGLLGPNGAGKSSLIRIINMISIPDSGEVLLGGRKMTIDDISRIGYLPEERGLYKKMKVSDHIVYLARLKGMEKREAYRQMDEWLERFDLMQWRNRKVETLSKGMQQKVQFIATVIHKPELLIFDEPFSGFDPVNAQQLKQEIIRLRDEGATILFSTHNMESVEEVCEEITLINHARVVLQGKVGEIKQQNKKNLFTVSVSGDKPVEPCENLFTVENSQNSTAQIRLKPQVEVRNVIAWLNDRYVLTSFVEQLPSMNEIFIETVKKLNA
ncbi:MAG: ATP-binding cassette domain-containing protein [Muribaculaceae bacterium]|nr:ATP-binding cassette domain-containing protein [Muribaculaceae bacterium]